MAIRMNTSEISNKLTMVGSMSGNVAEDQRRLTVADVLDMASVTSGEPRLLTSKRSTAAPVRWVHVVAGTGVAPLLDGGELLLTTGAGWPRDHSTMLAEVSELLQAGASALILELGHRFDEVPADLVSLFQSRGVALIELRREASFVRITEQVHRALLSRQDDAFAARDRIQTQMIRLALNRAPASEIVSQLASELRSPVVLENTQGEVVTWASGPSTLAPAELLAPWPHPPGQSLTARHSSALIESSGVRWGQLIALEGEPHVAGRSAVLELGAVALALSRASDVDRRDYGWITTQANDIFEHLFALEFRGADDVAAELQARGFAADSSSAVAFRATIREGDDESDSHVAALNELFTAALPHARLMCAPNPESPSEVLGVLVFDSARQASSAGSAPTPGPTTPSLIEGALQRELRAHRSLDPLRLDLVLSAAAHSVSDIARALVALRKKQTLSFREVSAQLRVSVLDRQPLAQLLVEIEADARTNRFLRSQLQPLLDYDARHRGDLVKMLAAYVLHPTNRSKAAAAANVSRSVFYQRLDLIRDLTAADLDDGATLAAFAVALEAGGHLSQRR